MMPDTSQRVPQQTDERSNEQIRKETEMSIAYYSQHPELIEERLKELDEEWDTERMLEANAAIVSLAGFVLGTIRNRIFYLVPPLVAGFLLQHAIQGWCPPLSIIRRFGVRTQREIDTERYALKAMRGDFKQMSEGQQQGQASEALEAVTRT